MDYVVSLDIPCDLAVARDHLTLESAIDLTVKNAIEMDRVYEMLKKRGWRYLPTPIPTIQGHREVEEFLDCLERFKEHSLIERYDYIGIGSLCMSKSPRFVHDVC